MLKKPKENYYQCSVPEEWRKMGISSKLLDHFGKDAKIMEKPEIDELIGKNIIRLEYTKPTEM